MENSKQDSYKLFGVVYSMLILPGFVLLFGSVFLFDDPKTMESYLAKIFFFLSFTIPFTLFVGSIVSFWKDLLSNKIGSLSTKILIYLPVIQITLLILTFLVILKLCNGEFCI